MGQSASAGFVTSFKRLGKVFAFALPALLALAACGGGGYGGNVNSTPPPPVAQFTSFTNVAANTATTIEGSTREGTAVVSSNGAILPSNVSALTEGSGNVTFQTNAQREITSLNVNGNSSSVSFGAYSQAETFFDAFGRPVAVALSNATGSDQTIYGDPFVLGFDYQSFGVWGTGLVSGSTARIGAISAGRRTAQNAVPTTGSANFNGVVGGIYVDPTGDSFRYGAFAQFAVDFGNRSIAMQTNGDTITNIATNLTSSTTTPMTANMTIAPDSNQFSGNFQIGSLMSGTGSGSFYGPAANELGGTFLISGSAGKILGGFGGGR